ncbi:hypothetical protein [Myceligenerans crystallogenes]
MGEEITEGAKVQVTGAANYERGTVGVVTAVRRGWCGQEAVIEVRGLLRSRKITTQVSDLTKRD